MEKLLVTLAYKYVALALMLAEANHAVRQLEIPGWNPVAPTNLVSYHVAPPRLMRGGSLDTTTHLFGFGRDGQLQFIHRLESDPSLSIEERHRRWAKMKSLIDTNGAYALASNWLARLEVDVVALEQMHPPSVVQEFYYSGSQSTRRVMLPRFEVRWGTNQMRPAVWVSIFGPTREPIHIRQEDVSFSRRPKGLVRDVERLLAIPNQTFVAYSSLQKSNLVVESAMTAYPAHALVELEKRRLDAPRSAGKQRNSPKIREAGSETNVTGQVQRLPSKQSKPQRAYFDP